MLESKGGIYATLAIFALISYLLGNINFALIISKFKKSDVRKVGSGNPGTLNMSRNFGLKIGLLTFFLDILKGGIPSLIGWLILKDKAASGLNLGDLARYTCGFFVIVGHIYPVFLKFKGGKGIASTIGVFLLSKPLPMLAVLLVAFIYMYITEMGSMASLIAVAGLAGVQFFIYFNKYGTGIYGGFAILLYSLILGICVLTFFAHRKNIVKLLKGTEHRTSLRSLSKKNNK